MDETIIFICSLMFILNDLNIEVHIGTLFAASLTVNMRDVIRYGLAVFPTFSFISPGMGPGTRYLFTVVLVCLVKSCVFFLLFCS